MHKKRSILFPRAFARVAVVMATAFLAAIHRATGATTSTGAFASDLAQQPSDTEKQGQEQDYDDNGLLHGFMIKTAGFLFGTTG